MAFFNSPSPSESGDLTAIGAVGSELTDILMADDIVPGAKPGYELCKKIFTTHPLGWKLTEGVIQIAQSQRRVITVSDGPEGVLIPAFEREWESLGEIGAEEIIKRHMTISRVYGISTLAIGDRRTERADPTSTAQPLKLEDIAEADLYFNILDPLNTAGSLVLDQDPNSPWFQRPRVVSAGGKEWHPSRTIVTQNEPPVFIDFNASTFGFTGRSVYQRALFPLKTFISTMIADEWIARKLAVLIHKAKSPSSAVNLRQLLVAGIKRANLKTAVTGNVLTIGLEEDMQSLNFRNVAEVGKQTRENVLKNIAVAAGGMPAALFHMETLTEGFGEGSEDAKQIARFIDRVRIEMKPIYRKLDAIVQRRAWSPSFYASVQRENPAYRKVPYEQALYSWINGFHADWPNLLVEPDSEKAKKDDVKAKALIGIGEVMVPVLDPKNLAAFLMWTAGEIGEARALFTAPLELDEQELIKHARSVGSPETEGTEREPLPESYET